MDKALLVAIGDYGSLLPKPLAGAPEALRTWRALLTKYYGFKAGDPSDPTVNLHTLETQQATKQSILRELQWLAVASQNDRIVFIFDGHGTSMNRRFSATDPSSPTYLEQGLVTYPEPSDTLATATLFGDEINGALRSTSARVLCVIDACHAQGVLDGIGPLQPRSLFIDARAFGFESSTTRLRLLTLVDRIVAASFETTAPSILVAAATQTDAAAYEVTIDGVRQMLFSYHAAALLDQHPAHSYKSLYALLVPNLTGFQTPILGGDQTRTNNQFTF